ncbi:MAG: hypothetical protein QNL31_00380 [Flavobacteriaceae bacterium]
MDFDFNKPLTNSKELYPIAIYDIKNKKAIIIEPLVKKFIAMDFSVENKPRKAMPEGFISYYGNETKQEFKNLIFSVGVEDREALILMLIPIVGVGSSLSQHKEDIKSAIIHLKTSSPKSYSKIVKLFGHFFGLKENSGCMSIIIVGFLLSILFI